MFDESNRYLTRDIQERLPTMIQLCLWNEIDRLKCVGIAVDYLQVFIHKKSQHIEMKYA